MSMQAPTQHQHQHDGHPLPIARYRFSARALDAVQLQSPIPCPAQDVVCLGINYMAHSDEAEKYSASRRSFR